MIPSKLNPLGIDRNYPLMHFEKDGNLYDMSKAVTGNALKDNGDGTYTSKWMADGVRTGNPVDLSIKVGESFTISLNMIESTATNIALLAMLVFTDNTTQEQNFAKATGNVYKNVVAVKDIKRVIIYFSSYLNAVGQSTIFKDFMIKKGTATAYPTYLPYNANTYSVEGQSTQEVRSVSKNLFDKSRRNISKFVGGIDGNLYDSTASDSSDYIPINPNTSYTISGSAGGALDIGLCWYDGSKNILSYVYSTNGVKTSPNNAKFARMTITKETVDTFQFELGSVANPYQPFVPLAPSPSPQYPSPIISNYPKGVYKTQWGYIRLYEDLRGIGEVRDKIVYNVGSREKMLAKNMGSIVFDGSEAWQTFATEPTENLRCFITMPYAKTSSKILCSHFEEKLATILRTQEGCTFDQYGNFGIGIKKTTCPTLNDFKNWLSNREFEVIYQLTTPLQQEL